MKLRKNHQNLMLLGINQIFYWGFTDILINFNL